MKAGKKYKVTKPDDFEKDAGQDITERLKKEEGNVRIHNEILRPRFTNWPQATIFTLYIRPARGCLSLKVVDSPVVSEQPVSALHGKLRQGQL